MRVDTPISRQLAGNVAVYEFVEHTADIRLRVRGAVLGDLFRAALDGMNAYMFGEEAGVAGIHGEVLAREEVRISAADTTDLLVAWLARGLFLSSVHRAATRVGAIDAITPTEVRATIEVVRAEPREEIKAVTYHGLTVENTATGYEAVITFDI
jgi:SHS2 domain-containing protein